jgi:hypothetical protein
MMVEKRVRCGGEVISMQREGDGACQGNQCSRPTQCRPYTDSCVEMHGEKCHVDKQWQVLHVEKKDAVMH